MRQVRVSWFMIGTIVLVVLLNASVSPGWDEIAGVYEFYQSMMTAPEEEIDRELDNVLAGRLTRLESPGLQAELVVVAVGIRGMNTRSAKLKEIAVALSGVPGRGSAADYALYSLWRLGESREFFLNTAAQYPVNPTLARTAMCLLAANADEQVLAALEVLEKRHGRELQTPVRHAQNVIELKKELAQIGDLRARAAFVACFVEYVWGTLGDAVPVLTYSRDEPVRVWAIRAFHPLSKEHPKEMADFVLSLSDAAARRMPATMTMSFQSMPPAEHLVACRNRLAACLCPESRDLLFPPMDKVAEEQQVRARLAELERAFSAGDEKAVLALVAPEDGQVVEPGAFPSLRFLLQRHLAGRRKEIAIQAGAEAEAEEVEPDVPVKFDIEIQRVTMIDRREDLREMLQSRHRATVDSVLTLVIGNKTIWDNAPRGWRFRKDDNGWVITAIVFPKEEN